VGGGSAMGLGIVRACWQKMLSHRFLLPIRLRSAGLTSNTRDLDQGGLITLPTDMIDYAAAADISENIRQRFGKIDLVVTAFDNDCSSLPLIETEIRDWQKIMDDSISAIL